MFCFKENFECYDTAYKPYGIRIESSSALWHKHARASVGRYTVYCTGNKYLLEMPETAEFSMCLTYQFEVLDTYAGISVFFGYDPELHTGYVLRTEWHKQNRTMICSLLSIEKERYQTVTSAVSENIAFPCAGMEYSLSVRMEAGILTVAASDGAQASFSLVPRRGLLGFSRPDFVGSVSFCSIEAVSAEIDVTPGNCVNVTVPTVNGGTMPLYVTYNSFSADGKLYLTATLDGGPQYRSDETYHPYPVNRVGQYAVERWFMTRPYVCVNDKTYHFSMGEVNLADPFLAWKEILYPLMHFTDLPLSVTVPLDSDAIVEYAFGYDELYVTGYRMQSGRNEFRFSHDGTYLGETVFPDTFRLRSPADKRAVQMIPDTVFDCETVRDHFARNHYFAEDEEIVFSIFAHTDKAYITYEAELQNVFGEYMEALPIADGIIHHAPLPVGVYHVHLTVFYGDMVLDEMHTAFEVFDETGERCAPLESGLPVMFSMPNEQQYLDRDPFDPWNNGAPANLEHYFSCTAFTGYVAEHRRIWEVTKMFGRSWYVWLSNHRTMLEHDWHDHMDILKNADYVYYPSDYEWAVLRSDCSAESQWAQMPKTVALLNEFLDTTEGARERVGYTRGERVTNDHIAALHKYYQNEWYALLQSRVTACFAEQNEMFTEINPKFKRACYGPFNVYVSHMRTSNLSESTGLASDDTLSDVIYTGFAQFEDYPYSCAYQTYRGAFGAGATLVNAPRLAIYPEQYKSARGGCIDGAVYYANPPVGAYVMPDWFNTSLTREYVYNTARKTEDGFAYWNTYGFMKSDLSDAEIAPFIHDWKYVLRYQPKKPFRSAVYVCQFDAEDNSFDGEYPGWRTPFNRSEEGVGYLYEISRLAGLPSGFFASWETLLTVTAEDTDVVVLPSTRGVEEKVIAHIRALYDAGVSLIAVGLVDGLEDLFGVRYAPREVHFCGIDANGEHEAVYPFSEPARYDAVGAEVLMTADGTPVLYRRDRTLLYNISPAAVGRAYFYADCQNARSSISPLLRKTSIALMHDLSVPTAVCTTENCGITVFEDTNGNTMLLIIDYSVHDQAKRNTVSEKTVMLTGIEVRNAEAVDGRAVRRLIGRNDRLDGITVSLHPHESALIRLF